MDCRPVGHSSQDEGFVCMLLFARLSICVVVFWENSLSFVLIVWFMVSGTSVDSGRAKV